MNNNFVTIINHLILLDDININFLERKENFIAYGVLFESSSLKLKQENGISEIFTQYSINFNNTEKKTITCNENFYTINLKDIDVMIKGIANRSFFTWEDGSHLDSIIANFERTPPVILEELNGKYYSVDGHHRITIANELIADY